MNLSVFSNSHFMKEALKQAELASAEGEVPVGAVIVCQNRIISRAYNQAEKLNDVTAHAEILAITAASNYLGSKYLDECTIYVTLEPCVMCAGALNWSQIQRVIFAAEDPQKGYNKYGKKVLHPKTEVSQGFMAEESKLLLDDFFRKIRN